MSDTCTLSHLSPISLTTVSVSPRWVIPVLYQSYHPDTVQSDIGDNCDRVQVSLILVILIQYSQRHKWTTVSVSPRWVIPVLYHSYHLCLWLYCICITKMSDTCTLSQLSPMTHLSDTDTVVRDIGDNCDRVQVSLILVILIQYSQRQRW
jgi:hypothetical protein